MIFINDLLFRGTWNSHLWLVYLKMTVQCWLILWSFLFWGCTLSLLIYCLALHGILLPWLVLRIAAWKCRINYKNMCLRLLLLQLLPLWNPFRPFQSWKSSFYQGVSRFSFLNSPKKVVGLDFIIEALAIGNCSDKERVLLIFILKTLSNGISLLYASQEELSLIQSNLQIC